MRCAFHDTFHYEWASWFSSKLHVFLVFLINSSFTAMDTYYDTDSQWKMDKFVSNEGTNRLKMA